MTAQLAEPMLRPKTIAIYGASDDPKKNTGRPQRYLDAHGFQGTVYPINPNRERVQGRRAFKAIADIPDQVDHALILVPQSAVLMAIKDCAAAGVKVATIYTDGFAEAGVAGQREQQQVMAVAKQAGMRVIGPNSIGIVNFGSALTLSAIASLEGVDIKAGSTAVVSQSGSLIGSIMSRGSARGLGFSTLVSVGNEADLSVADIVDLLVDEPETQTILLFLEAISDPVKLGQAVRRAHAADKPVVAYKLGRSSVGRDMAVAHTGAVAGSHAAAEAFFRHHGIRRVNMFETLFEIVPLLQYSAPTSGKRVAVLTTTGGGAAIVVDRLGEAGIEITNPPQSVRDAAAHHGITLGQGPLIDLTMAGVRKGVYQDVLEAALRAPDIDLVLAVVGSSAQHHAELAVDGIVRAGSTNRPLAVFLTPEAPEALSLLRDSGIAAFRTPEGCADAITTLLCTPAPTQMPAGLEVGRSAQVCDEGSTKSTTFDEVSSRRFLESRGVGTHSYALISETEMGIPSNMTFPLAPRRPRFCAEYPAR
ncbi:MAG: CoA-binding protein [Pseudomonadota bacterium]